jgi:hypothetical protein
MTIGALDVGQFRNFAPALPTSLLVGAARKNRLGKPELR